MDDALKTGIEAGEPAFCRGGGCAATASAYTMIRKRLRRLSDVDRDRLPVESPAATPLSVDVVSDVVCPWCYVGKRKLERALDELKRREPGLEIAVRWHPFELNPELPAEGIPRRAYLEAKFGASVGVHTRVQTVGSSIGIDFDFDRITVQPNTRDAHRLIAWAQGFGDAEPLVE